MLYWRLFRIFCDSYQELPSKSAKLSRPDTLSFSKILIPEFGKDPKTFNSQRVPCSKRLPRANVAFGVAHAPWSGADDSMETLQVQSAGVVAATLAASTVVSNTPAGGDSFTLTLGRFLENMPNSVQDGPSIASKASLLGKGDGGSNSDSSSMAGTLFNCFVTNMLQPAPTVALNAQARESTLSLPSPQSTSDPSPNSASSLDTFAGETGPNAGEAFIPAALGGVVEHDKLSAWTGPGLEQTGTAQPEPSKSNARLRGQVGNQSSRLVSTAEQNRLEDTATQPVSGPAWFPGLQDNSRPSQSVEQPVAGALSEPKQVQASNPGSAREAAPRQESQASPRFTDSWPRLGHPDPAQMQAVPQSLSSRDLQVASTPTLASSQVGQASPAFVPEARDNSTPVPAADHPNLAEYSSRLQKFAGVDLQVASNPPLAVGRMGQPLPGSSPEASDPSTWSSTTDRQAQAEFSSLPEKFASADVQVAPNPMLSVGQIGQPAPATSPEASDPSTWSSPTDHPEQAEFSSLLGKFASADMQVAFNPTLSVGQMGQSVPASGPEANDPSTLFSATDHPERAEISSRLVSFAGAEINVKVSGNESQPATVPDKFTTKSIPLAGDTLSSGLPMAAVNSVQTTAAPKSGDLANLPAKEPIHSAQVSSSTTTEVAWQKSNEPEAASAQASLSSAPTPVPPPQPDVNSQPATPAATLQKDSAPEANAIQPNGEISADSGESATHASPADLSTTGQGKSGQQNGPGSGANLAGVTAFAPSQANNAAADSTTNLLAAQAPSVPASHPSASAPQTPISSSQPPSTLSAWQNYDGGAGNIVRSASLSDPAHGAEMHVELRSGVLGPMDVRAVLHEGSVGAEIHVQGQEAHTLLAAGLPSLERTLGERNLRVENIAVYHDHMGGEMSGGDKQDQESGSYPSAQRQAVFWDNPPQPGSSGRDSLEDEELANPAAGLSVRA